MEADFCVQPSRLNRGLLLGGKLGFIFDLSGNFQWFKEDIEIGRFFAQNRDEKGNECAEEDGEEEVETDIGDVHVFHNNADAGREIAMDNVDHKGVDAQGDEEPIGTYGFKNFETKKNGDIGDDEASKYDEYRILRDAGEIEGAIADDEQKEDGDLYEFYVFK